MIGCAYGLMLKLAKLCRSLSRSQRATLSRSRLARAMLDGLLRAVPKKPMRLFSFTFDLTLHWDVFFALRCSGRLVTRDVRGSTPRIHPDNRTRSSSAAMIKGSALPLPRPATLRLWLWALVLGSRLTERGRWGTAGVRLETLLQRGDVAEVAIDRLGAQRNPAL